MKIGVVSHFYFTELYHYEGGSWAKFLLELDENFQAWMLSRLEELLSVREAKTYSKKLVFDVDCVLDLILKFCELEDLGRGDQPKRCDLFIAPGLINSFQLTAARWIDGKGFNSLYGYIIIRGEAREYYFGAIDHEIKIEESP